MSNEAPIRLSEVTYRMGSATLVCDLSFEVGKAETVVLLSRSGSGKTTALRLVNHGLMPIERAALGMNFRHIANATMRCEIEDVCRRSGYEPPVICTPNELIESDDAGQAPLHGESPVNIEDGSVWRSRTAGVSAGSFCDALTDLRFGTREATNLPFSLHDGRSTRYDRHDFVALACRARCTFKYTCARQAARASS